MTARPGVLITGFASIGTTGPSEGLPQPSSSPTLQLIDRWPTPGPRWAFLVPAFRPADHVPGLKTRRMDRLSAWALLGSALAIRDAQVDPLALEGDRTAVVFGTAFGCLDLTGEFLGEVAANAAEAPPILFPETLANLPASHVARHFGIRGPNLTLSAGRLSGEAALHQAAQLLETGEADRALVIAGDTLTRPLYEWYEAASMLAPACIDGPGASRRSRRPALVPGEGMGACLLETSGVVSPGRRVHGRYLCGWLGSISSDRDEPGEPGPGLILSRMLGGAVPAEVALVAPSAFGSWMAGLTEAKDRSGPAVRWLPSPEFGEFGGAGLLQVGVALTRLPETADGFAAVAGRPDRSDQVAAVVLATEPAA